MPMISATILRWILSRLFKAFQGFWSETGQNLHSWFSVDTPEKYTFDGRRRPLIRLSVLFFLFNRPGGCDLLSSHIFISSNRSNKSQVFASTIVSSYRTLGLTISSIHIPSNWTQHRIQTVSRSCCAFHQQWWTSDEFAFRDLWHKIPPRTHHGEPNNTCHIPYHSTQSLVFDQAAQPPAGIDLINSRWRLSISRILARPNQYNTLSKTTMIDRAMNRPTKIGTIEQIQSIARPAAYIDS